MGRTAESYLKETETKPIETLLDYAEWTDEALLDGLGHEFTVKDSRPHSPERLSQIERRIAHLVFEVEYRTGVYSERA